MAKKASTEAEAPVKATEPVKEPFTPPSDWLKIPIEQRPIWSPLKCKTPITGVLVGKEHLPLENVDVFVMQLTQSCDVILPGGAVSYATSGDVMVPCFCNLLTLGKLLEKPGVRYELQIKCAGTYGSDLVDPWVFEVRANPSPRVAK